MRKLREFFKNDQALEDEMAIRLYRIGSRKFIFTAMVPGAITPVLFLAIEYFRHGRYVLEGWQIMGFWAFGLIVGLALFCGPMMLFALYRWRKIERRVNRLRSR